MDAARWDRVKELFASALELEGEVRSNYLSKVAAADPDLAAEVASLLSAHGESSEILEAPAAAYFSGGSLPGSEESVVGARLGNYRLSSVIASGGMGSVYLAERADEEFEQKVAIKLIRPGFDSGQFLSRFLNERQTLAHLDHPNIAKLLDGGTADDGRPYLVMEYIEGLALDRYCEEAGLGLGARLGLFREVCGAVHYAHQSLVVHRDLKPGNILVTRDGVPKLLDFGIAKLLDPGLRAAGDATVEPLQAMTPYYASPEQVRGEPITTASDIYSLGVVLYQVLTGQLPYELRTLAPAELVQVVGETLPEAPSSALADGPDRDGAPRYSIPADVDAIVLMALRKEPARRYSSAEQFADDIERFQKHLPVIAGPDSFGYRARKFLKRNRAAVIAATLVVASLVAGIVGTTWQAAKARTEAAIANQVADLMVEIFDFSDPWKQVKGGDRTVREVLDQGARKIEENLALQPEIRASLLAVLGRVYQKLQEDPSSIALLESAAKLYQEEATGLPEKRAQALHHLGIAQRRVGDPDGAETTLRQALALRVSLYGKNNEETVATRNALGTALKEQGKWDEAEAAYQEALAERRSIHGERHESVALSIGNLGELAYGRGRLSEERAERQRWLKLAEERFRAAIDIDRTVLGRHPDLATMLNNLGMTLREAQRDDEAEPILREALDMRRDLLGESHPHLATSQNNLAILLYDRGEYAAAAELFSEALDMVRERLGEEHPLVAQIQENLDAARAERDGT